MRYRPPPFEHPPILYEDEYILAVEKPSGLLAVPGRGAEKQDCLLHRLQLSHPEARVVHRLDMGTSGLMLFARDPGTQAGLGRLFERRQVHKRYIAWIGGVPASATGEIDLPLSADWPNRPRQRVDRVNGRPAYTAYRVLTSDPDRGRSRVELKPATGRSHQLRVHMARLGHPILGDELYADAETFRCADRLMLHAETMRLAHPHSREDIRLSCPAPF